MKRIKFGTLDLNLLKVFAAIAQTGSVSAAADHLGISQPAASNALGRLRDMLDDPLFVRTGAGMAPTPRADALVKQINAPLHDIVSALTQHDRFDPATSDRTFRVSMSGLGEVVYLPRLVRAMFAHGPNLKLINLSLPAAELPEALATGHVDVALGIIDIEGHGIESEVLSATSFAAVAGHDRPLIHDMAELRLQRLLVSAPAATFRAYLEDWLLKAKLMDNVALQLSNFAAVPDLIQETELVAIVPHDYAQLLADTDRARIMPVALPPATRKTRLIWSALTTQDSACRWLRRTIQDCLVAPSAVADKG